MKKGTLLLQTYLPETLFWLRLPALVGWFGLSTGIFISSTCIPFLPMPPTTLYYTGIAVSVFFMCASVLLKKNGIRFIFFLIIGICVFQIKVISYNKDLSEISLVAQANPVIYGTVVSNPSLSGNRFQFQISTDSIVSDHKVYIKKHRFITRGPIAPLLGAHIVFNGIITFPERTRTPFIFNEFNYLFSNNIYGRVTFSAFRLEKSIPTGFQAVNNLFRSYVLDVIENFPLSEHRSLLRAAFLGENTFLPENIKSSFRKSGIYHLLAISGLHAGMLIAAAYFILLFLPINATIKHCIVLSILWSYQLLIGWSPSLLRATIMATIVIGTFFFEKKHYSLQSLGIAGIVLLIISPGAFFNPGYQLSFSASLSIILLFPRLNQFKPSIDIPFFKRIVDYVLSSFYVSMSGFLGTAPILLYHFGSLSLFGLVANIAAVLLMTIGMWLFFVSLALYPILSFMVRPLCIVIAFIFNMLFKIAAASESIAFSEITLPVPWPDIILFYVLLLLAFSALQKKYLKKFLILALPIYALLSAFSLFVHQTQQNTTILRVTTSSAAYTAVRWPNGGVWLATDPGYHFDKSYSRSIFDNWMRHIPYSHLEKAIVFNDTTKQLKKRSYDTTVCSGALSIATTQLHLPNRFDCTIDNTNLIAKSQPCSYSISTINNTPVLNIAQDKSSYSIPLTGSTSKNETITLIRLNGKKPIVRSFN